MICPDCGGRESICGIRWERCRICGHTDDTVLSYPYELDDYYMFGADRIWRKAPQKGQAELKKVRKKHLTIKECCGKTI